MKFSLEILVFILLLIDSIAVNFIAWTGKSKWYAKNLQSFSRYFPAAKGWSTYYLVLVLWMGFILYRFGAFS